MSTEQTNRKSTRLLGIPNKRTTTGDGVGIGNNIPATAWEIYNKRAATYDKELIKDWNDSLNTLLVFVSFLFSSIFEY